MKPTEELRSTCLPGVSHNCVSRSRKPESEKERMMTVSSGRRCSELLKSSSPLGLLAKMLLESSTWHSDKASLTWKVKPIMMKVVENVGIQMELFTKSSEVSSKSVIPSKHLLFQLYPSTHRTEEIGSGLLPTARVSEAEGAPVKNVVFKNGSFSRENQKGVRFGVKVKDVLAMLPTPRAKEVEAYRKAETIENCGTLSVVVRDYHKRGESGIKTGLKLQPRFVEWMMGFPQNWTDLNCPNQDIGLKG